MYNVNISDDSKRSVALVESLEVPDFEQLVAHVGSFKVSDFELVALVEGLNVSDSEWIVELLDSFCVSKNEQTVALVDGFNLLNNFEGTEELFDGFNAVSVKSGNVYDKLELADVSWRFLLTCFLGGAAHSLFISIILNSLEFNSSEVDTWVQEFWLLFNLFSLSRFLLSFNFCALDFLVLGILIGQSENKFVNLEIRNKF